MEPATVLCSGVAGVALGGWLAGRLRGIRSFPFHPMVPAPGRLLATGTIVFLGLLAAPRATASADPVPPMVRLADQDSQPTPPPFEVRRGDTLWGIAATTLDERNSRRPSNAEIAHFWPRIYETNRAVIGENPDLIFPGQRLVIP